MLVRKDIDVNEHERLSSGTVLLLLFCIFRFRFIMFNATFNNISVISWRSAVLMEETTDMS